MKMKFLFLLGAGIILAGCDAVFTPEPLGEEVVVLNAEEWQGTWLGGDMVVVTTVLDPDKGLLQAAWIERSESGARLEVVESSIRSSGELVFANIEDNNENVEQRYHWLRIDKEDRRMTIWGPNLEQFKLMVADGRLPGKESDDGVVLGKLGPEHIAMINDPSMNLLDWKDPGVFFRIAD